MGWGPVLGYRDAIQACVQHRVLTPDVGEALTTLVRTHHLIVHRYLDIDYKTLYQQAAQLSTLLPRFEKQVRDFVKAHLQPQAS